MILLLPDWSWPARRPGDEFAEVRALAIEAAFGGMTMPDFLQAVASLVTELRERLGDYELDGKMCSVVQVFGQKAMPC